MKIYFENEEACAKFPQIILMTLLSPENKNSHAVVTRMSCASCATSTCIGKFNKWSLSQESFKETKFWNFRSARLESLISPSLLCKKIYAVNRVCIFKVPPDTERLGTSMCAKFSLLEKAQISNPFSMLKSAHTNYKVGE